MVLGNDEDPPPIIIALIPRDSYYVFFTCNSIDESQ